MMNTMVILKMKPGNIFNNKKEGMWLEPRIWNTGLIIKFKYDFAISF